MANQETQTRSFGSWVRGLRHSVPTVFYTLLCVCVMTVVLMIGTIFFRVSRVDGDSMQPTLQSGDILLLTCVGYTPQTEDVIAVRRDTGTPIIKRVIGTAGDRIYIDAETGDVYRNGELLNEAYHSQATAPVDLPGEVIVPEGQLFVMGDNRAVSHDSRYADVGFVKEDDVIGRAVWRMLPMNKTHRIQ